MWAGGTPLLVEKRTPKITPRYAQRMKLYHVYIMASFRRVLYIGITGNLEKRLAYHRSMQNPNAFTARYGVTRLVYVEEFTDVNQAITRETQLKSWRRAKKIRLIQSLNPHWDDLAPVAPPSHTDSSLRSE